MRVILDPSQPDTPWRLRGRCSPEEPLQAPLCRRTVDGSELLTDGLARGTGFLPGQRIRVVHVAQVLRIDADLVIWWNKRRNSSVYGEGGGS